MNEEQYQREQEAMREKEREDDHNFEVMVENAILDGPGGEAYSAVANVIKQELEREGSEIRKAVLALLGKSEGEAK